MQGSPVKHSINGSLLILLQAYITSWRGHIWREHSQADHTHIDPDVGLGGARGRLLPEEEEVAGKELQLGLPRLGLQDDLRRRTGKPSEGKSQQVFLLFITGYTVERKTTY